MPCLIEILCVLYLCFIAVPGPLAPQAAVEASLRSRSSNMGGTQSTPKITAQDRAILEYASHPILLYALLVDHSFLSSLKIQRDKLKQYQKKVGVALLYRSREGRNTWQLICPPFL
jgi:hypothetical protein